jgi:hypothetical protein
VGAQRWAKSSDEIQSGGRAQNTFADSEEDLACRVDLAVAPEIS